MSKQIKDVDYLAISARVRAMENGLLTAEQYDQLLAAKSDEEVAKLLQSFGYPQLDPSHPDDMDAALSEDRSAMLEDLGSSIPDPGYLDVFKIKYDYHNIKAILKAEAMETSASGILTDLGRVKAEELAGALREGELSGLPGLLEEAVAEGREVLSATRDPQLGDAALDKWYFRDLLKTAEDTGSDFLLGFVRRQLDCANLRTLVRTLRMGKTADFLRGVLFEGGEVGTDELLRVSANAGGGLLELYAPTDLADAAEAGSAALSGGSLTEFEKRCDDAVNAYLDAARLIPFGEAPVLSYLAMRETEYMNLRIVLLGHSAGIPADVIRSRLRAGCV
ncbi:MAG: V-type ATP synthase subunit C [Ruminococcaceae bacterium]|nr:V-type ATP synthase subunit C [Oscillospiraceae bacterium]